CQWGRRCELSLAKNQGPGWEPGWKGDTPMREDSMFAAPPSKVCAVPHESPLLLILGRCPWGAQRREGVMNRILRRPNGILMAGSLAFATLLATQTAADREAVAESAPPTLARIETTLVDGATILSATFQSNNQKVVANARGIFMTHLRTRNEPYTAQTWRLSWSRDGGKTFPHLHEATHATNPPILETDAQSNLYLVRMDFTAGDAYLYRFLSADDYADPKITRIPRGSAGKYAMVIDPGRHRLYYFAHNGTFHIL